VVSREVGLSKFRHGGSALSTVVDDDVDDAVVVILVLLVAAPIRADRTRSDDGE